jgi:DNA-directed RNA polymerase beta subunit
MSKFTPTVRNCTVPLVIIPFKGSWIEFATDVNSVMYAYIDRKKKFPVTTLLRAIGYGTDKDILDLFGLSDEVEGGTRIPLKKSGSPQACCTGAADLDRRLRGRGYR